MLHVIIKIIFLKYTFLAKTYSISAINVVYFKGVIGNCKKEQAKSSIKIFKIIGVIMVNKNDQVDRIIELTSLALSDTDIQNDEELSALLNRIRNQALDREVFL